MTGDNILYALIARGTTVLVEASEVSGNAHLVAHRILDKLSQDDSRVSYSQERHLFHIVVRDGITFLCMADEDFGRRIPFAFLEDVRERYLARFGDSAQSAPAYAHNAEFSKVLEERMEYYSNNEKADTINRVRGGISEVKNVMIENIDKVLDRGERIELLVDKTDHLQNESFAFKREARRLKSRLWWKNTRLLIFLAVLVLIIAYIICQQFV
ncbi:g6457 [Coccomyxa viridis]|uniref:G6457 protein n=1 Tax=Coccomyxa viridis TaxID=1274662 RepID=A0ABP1FVF4_9CHLO